MLFSPNFYIRIPLSIFFIVLLSCDCSYKDGSTSVDTKDELHFALMPFFPSCIHRQVWDHYLLGRRSAGETIGMDFTHYVLFASLSLHAV